MTEKALFNFIWQIADLLRGPYRPPQYERVMLPMVVLRRFDCVLESTKKQVVAELKLFRDVFAETNPDAKPVIESSRKPKRDSLGRLYGWFPLPDGKTEVKYEADTSLRDAENIPLKENESEYFVREVEPFVPDAWIDADKTKIGYEINFNRHFYVFKPPRPLSVIDAELKEAEDEIRRLLDAVTE